MRITMLRVLLSPVFLAFFFVLERNVFDGGLRVMFVVIFWGIYTMIGVSDLLDGWIARKYKLVSDAGKVLDPLADVLTHTTYFICLVHLDILWSWLCIIILYRELMIIAVRMLLSLKGVSFAAGSGGKLKSSLFTAATILGFVFFSLGRLGILAITYPVFEWSTRGLFIVAAGISYWSFIRYIRKIGRERLFSRPSRGEANDSVLAQ